MQFNVLPTNGSLGQPASAIYSDHVYQFQNTNKTSNGFHFYHAAISSKEDVDKLVKKFDEDPNRTILKEWTEFLKIPGNLQKVTPAKRKKIGDAARAISDSKEVYIKFQSLAGKAVIVSEIHKWDQTVSIICFCDDKVFSIVCPEHVASMRLHEIISFEEEGK